MILIALIRERIAAFLSEEPAKNRSEHVVEIPILEDRSLVLEISSNDGDLYKNRRAANHIANIEGWVLEQFSPWQGRIGLFYAYRHEETVKFMNDQFEKLKFSDNGLKITGMQVIKKTN